MATPKKLQRSPKAAPPAGPLPSSPKPAATPMSPPSWRTAAATAPPLPLGLADLQGANRRARDESPVTLSKLLSNIAVLGQPASNMLNLIHGGGDLGGAMRKSQAANKKSPVPITVGPIPNPVYFAAKAADLGDSADAAKKWVEAVTGEGMVQQGANPITGMPLPKQGSEEELANPYATNRYGERFLGPRTVQKLAEKEAAKKIARERAQAADAALSAQREQRPFVERALNGVPLVDVYTDSRAGTAASAGRANFGPAAQMLIEAANPFNVTPFDVLGTAGNFIGGAMLRGRKALPQLTGIGIGEVPFGPTSPVRGRRAQSAPEEVPTWWAPPKPEPFVPRGASRAGDAASLAMPTTKATRSAPRVDAMTPMPSAAGVSDSEWLAAAREAMRDGSDAEGVAQHLGITPEEATHLMARVAPDVNPRGYQGIKQAPRAESAAPPSWRTAMKQAESPLAAMPAPPAEPPIALPVPEDPITPIAGAARSENQTLANWQALQDRRQRALRSAPSVPPPADPSPPEPAVAPVAGAMSSKNQTLANWQALQDRKQRLLQSAPSASPPVESITPNWLAGQDAPPPRQAAASWRSMAPPAQTPPPAVPIEQLEMPPAPRLAAPIPAPTPSAQAAQAAPSWRTMSAPAPAPPAMRAANGAPMQAPPATGPTQDAMPPAAPYAPSVPPPPAAPPVAPVASAAPVEPPAVAPQAMPPAAAVPTPPVEPPPPPKPVVTPVAPERSRFAPSKPVAPAPRVQEAPPVQAPAAPQYAPVDVPGVREPVAPVAPVAPAVGAGTAAPPGVVPPAPEMAPLPASLNARAAQLPPGVDAAAMDRVERIAARWGQMDSKEKIRVNRALSVAEKQALNELIAPGRYGDPTARAKHGAGGSQVGFLGLTPQLVEGAGREVGKAFQSLEKAAEDFAGSVARVAPSGFSPQTRRVAQKAKEAVQYWTRKSMLTDNVQDAERLTDLLEGVADSSAGIARRAKDDWAPLRDLPKDVQTEVVAALRDPAKMAALVASNPEVGAMASKARGKITDLTQQVLRQQFGVEEATWAALSTQEKKILDEALRNENTLLPNRQMAVLTDLSRAKLIASGALRPVPGKKGRYEFKDQMLSTSEALDNADAYLQRKYAAFEGGRGAATPEAIIAKHPNLTDDEKTRIYELLGNSQSSAGDPRTLRERGMLLARQNISPALRAALGELTGDAGYLVPKTIQDMEKHVALSQTREAIAGNSNWVAPIDETPEAAAARWGVQPTRLSEDVTRNGLLAGRWVHPEVADVLQAQWGFHNPGAAAEAMRGLVGKWKWAKTVANPGSHARQWVQNSVAFDLAAGGWIDGVRRTRDAIGEIAQQGPLYKEARDAGLLRGNFHDAELSRVMHQEALQLEPGPDGMLGHLGSFGELLHTLGGKADRAWQIADEATQVGLFGWAREQGMTAQQAVRYVRDVTYDSSSMSRLERLASGRGVGSTMTPRSGKVGKTINAAVGTLDLVSSLANAPFAMSSLYGLRRGAKSLLGIGHNHWMPLTDPALAFRASKYWVLPTLAASAAGAAVMESRPDYEQPLLDNQLPKTVPLPSQVSAFLGEDGKPNFLDIGAFVPWGEAARAVYDTSKLSGEHDPQSMNPLQHAAAMATGGAMSMVRGGLNPILQTGVDIAQNRDTFSGKPVYNPSMGGREILSKSLGQATRNLLPDFTPGIPAALASGDVRDLIKEGGAGFAKLGAGAYNFAADRYSDATGQAVDHMADYRFRDQSLPRALLSTLLGVRTYDGDAEKNATFRETDRKSAVAEENKNYRRLLRQPQRTDAQRADDEKRHLQRLKNIATGGPQKWRGATPNADTLRGLLGL